MGDSSDDSDYSDEEPCLACQGQGGHHTYGTDCEADVICMMCKKDCVEEELEYFIDDETQLPLCAACEKAGTVGARLPCARCGEPLKQWDYVKEEGVTNYSFKEKTFHAACYHCDFCKQSLLYAVKGEETVVARALEGSEHLSCQDCYHRLRNVLDQDLARVKESL